jgi:1-deoxy-D-xylulose-5-phosphate reductoisomerase
VSRPLVVLGATGSVGRQTLEVAEHLGLQVTGMGARLPSPEFRDVALSHPGAALAVAGGSSGERKEFVDSLPGHHVEFGSEALIALAVRPAHTVMNAVVGLAGLPFTLAALEAGNRLALANKESLVAAGPLVLTALARGGGELIPVDSEHSAIFQCLMGEDPGALARLILTASGGPFRGWSRARMEEVTPAQALKHPNWVMGQRITVDSATLVNKALEVIEANQLFGMSLDRIEVVIHPQSVVHSMVEFSDGSTKAHLGYPDMRIPIAFALTYPVRGPGLVDGFLWPGQNLTFEEVDLDAFPALALGFAAGRQGGSAPTVFNAADEIAVEAFLTGRLGFNGISRVISDALETVLHSNPSNLEQVIEVDREARAIAASLIAGAC